MKKPHEIFREVIAEHAIAQSRSAYRWGYSAGCSLMAGVLVMQVFHDWRRYALGVPLFVFAGWIEAFKQPSLYAERKR